MKKIYIVFGGASVEHDVSILTGLQAVNMLKDSIEVVPIYFSLDNRFYLTKFIKPSDYIDKENVVKKSCQVTFWDRGVFKVKNGKLIKIGDVDSVLNCCHGGYGECGKLKAFFDMANIKCSSAESCASEVCMNKYLTKLVAKDVGIVVVDGVLVEHKYIDEGLARVKSILGDNLILKPNALGSSIGVMRTSQENIKQDIETTFAVCDEVLVENCVENMAELNCAVYKKGENLVLSEIEKVGGAKDLLSFDDKYCGSNSKREIPAKISKKLEDKIYEFSTRIYQALGLQGVIRIDYMYDEKAKKLYLNEINTIPGSLAYYLFQGKGISYTMLIKDIVEQDFNEKKQTYFKSDILLKTGLKIK